MRLLVTALLLFSIEAAAQTVSEAQALIQSIETANDLCTSRGSSCLNSARRPLPNPRRAGSVATTQAVAAPPLQTQTTISDIHQRDLKISIIPESQIAELTRLYPRHLDIYNDENCASRAHVIGDTLAKNGIETVKLLVQPKSSWLFPKFIIPDNRVRNQRNTIPTWEFHIANLIYVQKADGSLVEYIIDPFMESRPVPRTQWEARLRTNPKSSIESMDIVSRYVRDPSERNSKVLEYDQSQLDRAYQTMSGSAR